MRLILTILLSFCFSMAFTSVYSDVDAQIFLRSKGKNESSAPKESRKSFLSRLFSKKQRRGNDIQGQYTARSDLRNALSDSGRLNKARAPAQFVPFSKEAFAVYKLARNVDRELLTSFGRSPQTADELMQVADFHNTGRIVKMLENRRRNMKQFKQYKQKQARAHSRIDLLRQRASLRQEQLQQRNSRQDIPRRVEPQSETRAIPARPNITARDGANLKNNNSSAKPSRVFRNY